MHALVVRVEVAGQPNNTVLREQIVPRVKAWPGFVAGYWTREGNEALSMVVFDSEENARAARDTVSSVLPDNVTIRDNHVLEVVASA
jgi:hypothetical protein